MSSAAEAPNGIVLFWYKASPYGRRIKAYLTLRNIQHAECLQPPILPRPDQTALGVNYRRSPIMAIGRDIYVDSRLMIAKLEEMFPGSAEHPGLSSRETQGVAALLRNFVVDNMFVAAVRNFPPGNPMTQNAKFQKDRSTFFPPDWRNKDVKSLRPEGITHMRHCFDIAESMFVDGRTWIAGTEKLSLADLEGIWVFDWFISDLQPLKQYFGPEGYPSVYAWRDRYRKELDAAKARAARIVSLQGADAVTLIAKSEYADKASGVDENDPLGLQAGALVDVFPVEGGGGYTHQDRGRLVKLTKDEVAIAVESKSGEEMRIHAPRWQFRVRPVAEGGAKL